MGAEFCNIQPGDTIAVWGCGPVGQMAIRSCFLLGAERVLAIDTVPERLLLARQAGAQTLDFLEEDIYERIQELLVPERLTRAEQQAMLRAAGARAGWDDPEMQVYDREEAMPEKP